MAKPPPPVDDKARREARLAQALRDNLRKRKASAAKAKPAPKAQD